MIIIQAKKQKRLFKVLPTHAQSLEQGCIESQMFSRKQTQNYFVLTATTLWHFYEPEALILE